MDSGRDGVLISPISVVHAEWPAQRLEAALTKKQVENSPNIDTHQPVFRQHEAAYSGYYGYPYYWDGPYLWGSAFYAAGLAISTTASRKALADKIGRRVNGFASAQHRSRQMGKETMSQSSMMTRMKDIDKGTARRAPTKNTKQNRNDC